MQENTMKHLVSAPRLIACMISVFNILSVLLTKSVKGNSSRVHDAYDRIPDRCLFNRKHNMTVILMSQVAAAAANIVLKVPVLKLLLPFFKLPNSGFSSLDTWDQGINDTYLWGYGVKGTYIINISTAKIYVDSIWTVNYGTSGYASGAFILCYGVIPYLGKNFRIFRLFLLHTSVYHRNRIFSLIPAQSTLSQCEQNWSRYEPFCATADCLSNLFLFGH